jgi:4,5:9,10-diseco-3-hydroxy-5,9,17-trioxoandrosta-1(10),2-diene-4-oate hydrolase
VKSLVLIGSAGLGVEVTPVLRWITTPFQGDIAAAWGKTALGSIQRVAMRIPLLFGNPLRVPAWWILEQTRLAQRPGFLRANLDALRALVDLRGQRVVLLDRLPDLELPTLLIWGGNDSVLPLRHAQMALSRLPMGSLEVIPVCGHMPHVEWADRCGKILDGFLQEA